MIVGVFTHLITGEGQFRTPLHYCWESQLGSSLWILWNFPSTRFLPNPKKALSTKISLSLLSRSVPVLALPSYFLMFSIFHSLPFTTPVNPDLPRRSHLIPLPRVIHVSVLGTILNFIWKSSPEQFKQSCKMNFWRHHYPLLQTLLQSYSNKNRLILALKQTRGPIESN